MPLALTIFGVGADSGPFRFCYAVLRKVRGIGGYQMPSLPGQRAFKFRYASSTRGFAG